MRHVRSCATPALLAERASKFGLFVNDALPVLGSEATGLEIQHRDSSNIRGAKQVSVTTHQPD